VRDEPDCRCVLQDDADDQGVWLMAGRVQTCSLRHRRICEAADRGKVGSAITRRSRVVQKEIVTVNSLIESCPICGGRVESGSAERDLRVGKRTVTLTIVAPACVECGEYFLSPNELEEIQLRASELIRKEEGLLFPQQIEGIRKKLRLSQTQFERLLGVGEKTVVRWERGTVFQNSATDNLLRVLDAVPEALAFLAKRQEVDLGEGSERQADVAELHGSRSPSLPI